MAVIIQPVGSYDTTLSSAVRDLIRNASIDWAALMGRVSPPLVVVKPNWVQESPAGGGDQWEPLITNPLLVVSVVRALAEIFHGLVHIVVCDAPHTYARFESIIARGDLVANLAAVRRTWPQMQLDLLDLRRETWVVDRGVVVRRCHNPPDPLGYVILDLGEDSLFFGHKGEGRFYGADYDRVEVNRHHSGRRHEYLLAGTPVAADLFINLPKLKTHKKTGLTCAAKNLVGINGDKNWLPHHTEGDAASGGDDRPDVTPLGRAEMSIKRWAQRASLRSPRLAGALYGRLKQAGTAIAGRSDCTIRNGNWHGNDTCWRMALDLNRALLYGGLDGRLGDGSLAKPYVTIVDGVIGGEGNGPLDPDPVASGILIYSDSPAEADATAAKLMGFDINLLPVVRQAFEPHRWPLSRVPLQDVVVSDRRVGSDIPLNRVETAVPGGFVPHFGWRTLNQGLRGV